MSLILDGTAGVTGPATKVIVGTTTNDDAAAGYVGEYISSSVTSATAGTTATTLTSIPLTAGDWDISISVNSGGVPGTSIGFRVGLSTTSATFLTDYQEVCFVYQDTVQSVMSGCIPNMRKSIASTTTYYLIAQSYTTANIYVQGRISARRRR
jgi:hypothetical protein